VCCRIQHRHWATQPLRTLNFFPINHIGCVGDISCFTLVGGGCIVFLEQFDPAACLALIAAERISFWGGVPTTFLLTLQAAAFESADLSTVQRIVWSGAAASAELIHALAALGKWIGTSYGLTETVGSVTFTAPDAAIATLIETVGRPPPEYGLRIVDETGRPVQGGTAGEIQVRGDCQMIGYWQRSQATAEAFDGLTGGLKPAISRRYAPMGTWYSSDAARTSSSPAATTSTRASSNKFWSAFPAYDLPRSSGSPIRCTAWWATHSWFPERRRNHQRGEDLERATAASTSPTTKCRKAFTVTADLPMLPIGKIDKRALAARTRERP
jgi:acyl-CoA synthetase (AMP-forming)/AMP-acid ligase II